jgi:hypothetical protein
MELKINEKLVVIDEYRALTKWETILEAAHIEEKYQKMISVYCEFFNLKYPDNNLLPVNIRLFSLLKLNDIEINFDENIANDLSISLKNIEYFHYKNGINCIQYYEDNLINKLADKINATLSNKKTITINKLINNISIDFENNNTELKISSLIKIN